MKDLTDIRDRLDKQRAKRTLEAVRGPAQLLLFPLCDTRGLVSHLLGCSPYVTDEEALQHREAESIFFAWLLELPTGIDSADAARALLLVSESAGTGDVGIPHSNEQGATDSSFCIRETMIGLLQRAGSSGSLFEAPQKIPGYQLQ